MNYIIRVSAIIMLLLVLIAPASSIAAYRKSYRFEESYSAYILVFNAVIVKFGNYGVFTIYLKPDGIYAYGLALMKDPDEECIHAYLLAGAQDRWFDLGFASSSNISFTMVLDTVNKFLIARFNNHSIQVNLSFSPLILELYTASLNITGRSSDYPLLNITRLYVFAGNIPIAKYPGLRLDKPVYTAWKLGLKTLLNITHRETILEQSPTQTPNPKSRGGRTPGYTGLILYLILPAVITILSITLIIYILYQRKQKYGARELLGAGSPGP